VGNPPSRSKSRHRIKAKKGTDPILAKKEAERADREAKRARKEAEEKWRAEEERRKYTFNRLAEDYIEGWAKKRKRSWKTDLWYIKNVLNPEFERRPAAEVTLQEIVNLLDRIVAEGTPVKANRALACVRKIYNWGFKKGKVSITPCVLIDRPGREQSRERVLSVDSPCERSVRNRSSVWARALISNTRVYRSTMYFGVLLR
jgi:hypothetical protein